jgi:uncharacterized protein
MSIKEQIMADIKEAMKARQMDKVSALRFLQSAIKNREIELRPNQATDEDVIGVIKKNVKQRKESIEQYQNAGRQDLADAEAKELAILESYMPAMLPEEKVAEIVQQVIQDTGASSIKDMGSVMKEVLARTQGQADNKVVSQIVKSRLQP